MGGRKASGLAMRFLSFLFVLLISVNAHAKKYASTFVFDESKDDVVSASEANVTRPIASLTKVMTAIVALEYDANMNREMKIAGGSRLPAGVNLRGDVFTAMLVRSDNQAAEILASDYPGGRKAFIKAMNKKADELGMFSARFVDPSGLSSSNVATVGEVATMIRVAALQPILSDTSILQHVEIKKKKYKVILDNTNKKLLASFDEIKFSKTGFTNPAGWCVAMVIEKHGKRFVVVVLGANDKNHRYDLAKKLIEKHFSLIEQNIEEEKKYEEQSFWKKLLESLWPYNGNI